MGEIIGLIALIFLQFLLPFILVWMWYDYHAFRIHNFHSNPNVHLPSLVTETKNEQVSMYCDSISGRSKLYLTNKRLVLFKRSLLGTSHRFEYFKSNEVKIVGISFKNPYYYLIIAGIFSLMVFLKLSDNSGNRTSSFLSPSSTSTIITYIILAVAFTGLYFFFKGFSLKLKNLRATYYVQSRSNKGLRILMALLDDMNLHDKPIGVKLDGIEEIDNFGGRFGDPDNPLMTSKPAETYTAATVKTKDVICGNCKSVIELDENDLAESSYTCPVCSHKNMNMN